MPARTRMTNLTLATTSMLVVLGACSKAGTSNDAVSSAEPVVTESHPNSVDSANISRTDANVSSASNNGEEPSYDPCDTTRDASETTGSDGVAPENSRYEPPGVTHVGLNATAALRVYASTLVPSSSGLALYVGVCNQSQRYQCSAAMQVELYDEAGEVLGTVSNAVQSGRVFNVSESPYPISCVAPGQRGMAAITDLPSEVTLEQVKSLGYRFSVFQFDEAAPLASTRVTHVEPFAIGNLVAFRGTVTNDATVSLTNPVVSVFPLNTVGRPLGFATAGAAEEIPPGGTWSFETSAVAERGATHVAYAAGTYPVDR